jgi:glutathione S-transferase
MSHYAPTVLVTVLALFVYVWNFVAVGRARGKFGIDAPAVTGHPDFERAFRVQQNMVEQLVVFIPVLWLFSATVSIIAGAIVGLVWVAGRILYSVGYYQAAEKRSTGFLVATLAGAILLIGSLVGGVGALL